MAENSAIEWTDHTFSPWWGCVKISPACDHCYAETFSKRVGFSESGSKFPIWGKDSQRRFLSAKHWKDPLKWDADAKRDGVRKRVFCGSMCDVMEDRPDVHNERRALYALIDSTPNLDWLMLTKRPQNYRRLLPMDMLREPRPNVWGMTTVEASDYLWRIDALLDTSFAIYGLSMEPLLGRVTLPRRFLDLGKRALCITGGESGPHARPSHPDWFRSLRDQCNEAGVAFLFKQWGEYAPLSRTDGIHEVPFGEYDPTSKFGFLRLGKKAAGRLLDGREWNEMPEVRS